MDIASALLVVSRYLISEEFPIVRLIVLPNYCFAGGRPHHFRLMGTLDNVDYEATSWGGSVCNCHYRTGSDRGCWYRGDESVTVAGCGAARPASTSAAQVMRCGRWRCVSVQSGGAPCGKRDFKKCHARDSGEGQSPIAALPRRHRANVA